MEFGPDKPNDRLVETFRDEIEAYMARYKAAAGFAVEHLNAAPPTIPPGSRAPTS